MSGVTQRLIFDPTDGDSRLATANVGAYVRSGQAGALVTHQPEVKPSAGTINFADGDVTVGTDIINSTAHDLNTGDLVQLTTTGVLPTGLALATDYYVIRVDADNIKLAASPLAAENGTAVDITAAAGGGTHTATGQEQDIRALDVWLRNPSLVVEATDFDIRDLNSATDSVTAIQGTSPWTVDGSVSITGDVNVTQGTDPWVVSAVDLDIRDLTHVTDSVKLGDGTTLYTGTTVGADHGLDVNVINPEDIDIDDDLANTAIENTATAVSTTAVAVVASALADRKWLWLANEGNKSTYWGKSGVTTTIGFPLHPGMQHVARIGASVVAQIIGGTGANAEDIRVMELS